MVLSSREEKEEYLNTHNTANKLFFVIEHNVSVQEELFLLQQLYNDGLHMDENAYIARNKIQSACLKLDNKVIQNIVQRLFNVTA